METERKEKRRQMTTKVSDLIEMTSLGQWKPAQSDLKEDKEEDETYYCVSALSLRTCLNKAIAHSLLDAMLLSSDRPVATNYKCDHTGVIRVLDKEDTFSSLCTRSNMTLSQHLTLRALTSACNLILSSQQVNCLRRICTELLRVISPRNHVS